MRKLGRLMVLMGCTVMTCNAQLIRSSTTENKPIAPKGFILFSEDGARAALSDAAELRLLKRQLALKDSVIAELVKIDAAHHRIDGQQQVIIRKQQVQNFWANTKMYGGYGLAFAILIFRR